MYEATKSEREALIKIHNYNPDIINVLDAESDKVRHGVSIDFSAALAVCDYQTNLQAIRKSQKRWYQF